METIGEILRAARDKHGLTVAEVHEATKISIHNLLALEEERFDVFANKVYARAFLRDYANFLGIESAPLLQKYEELHQTPAPSEPQPSRRRTPILAAAMTIVVAVVGYAGIYHGVTGEWPFTTQEVYQAPAPEIDSPVTYEPEAAEPEILPVQPAEPEALQAEAAEEAEAEDVAAAAEASKQLHVKLNATERSWVRIWVDGNRVYEGTLAPGDSSDWSASKEVRVYTGNAGGLQVVVDGQPQPALGSSGQIAERTWRKEQ